MNLTPADLALAARIAAANPMERPSRVPQTEAMKTAHGVKRGGLAHLEGEHLSDAPNEPTFSEAELLAGDRARDEGKAERAADREFPRAMALQLRANDIADVIGRRS